MINFTPVKFKKEFIPSHMLPPKILRQDSHGGAFFSGTKRLTTPIYQAQTQSHTIQRDSRSTHINYAKPKPTILNTHQVKI